MNELDLLQEGLGNGTYYVVAENTDGRKSVNSNEVEVSDIMPSVKITKCTILENGDLEVYFNATDVAAGTRIYAAITVADEKGSAWDAGTDLAKATNLDDCSVLIQKSVTSYKITLTSMSKSFAHSFGDPAATSISLIIWGGELIFAVFDSVNSYDWLERISNVDEFDAFSNFWQLTYNKVSNKITATANSEEQSKYSAMTDGATDLYFNQAPAIPAQVTPSNISDGFVASKTENGQVALYAEFTMGDDTINDVIGFVSYDNFVSYGITKFMLYKLIFTGAYLDSTRIIVSSSLSVDTTLDAPTLTYAASDRKLEWEDVEGATSYAVYKDGKKVGTVENNKFTPDPAAAAATLKAEAKTARLATLRPRAVYDLDKKVVGYVTPEGKFVKSLDKN